MRIISNIENSVFKEIFQIRAEKLIINSDLEKLYSDYQEEVKKEEENEIYIYLEITKENIEEVIYSNFKNIDDAFFIIRPEVQYNIALAQKVMKNLNYYIEEIDTEKDYLELLPQKKLKKQEQRLITFIGTNYGVGTTTISTLTSKYIAENSDVKIAMIYSRKEDAYHYQNLQKKGELQIQQIMTLHQYSIVNLKEYASKIDKVDMFYLNINNKNYTDDIKEIKSIYNLFLSQYDLVIIDNGCIRDIYNPKTIATYRMIEGQHYIIDNGNRKGRLYWEQNEKNINSNLNLIINNQKVNISKLNEDKKVKNLNIKIETKNNILADNILPEPNAFKIVKIVKNIEKVLGKEIIIKKSGIINKIRGMIS